MTWHNWINRNLATKRIAGNGYEEHYEESVLLFE